MHVFLACILYLVVKKSTYINGYCATIVVCVLNMWDFYHVKLKVNAS
jgi:hypothetical protein